MLEVDFCNALLAMLVLEFSLRVFMDIEKLVNFNILRVVAYMTESTAPKRSMYIVGYTHNGEIGVPSPRKKSKTIPKIQTGPGTLFSTSPTTRMIPMGIMQVRYAVQPVSIHTS